MGRCPNGESIASFTERILASFWQCVRAAESAGESRLVFVVHGGVIMALLSAAGRPKKGFYDWYLRMRAVCCVRISGVTITLLSALSPPAALADAMPSSHNGESVRPM